LAPHNFIAPAIVVIEVEDVEDLAAGARQEHSHAAAVRTGAGSPERRKGPFLDRISIDDSRIDDQSARWVKDYG